MSKIIDWFLEKWTDNLPCRIICEEKVPYLERFHVKDVLGYRFLLHKFVGSDPDRGLHDHPWKHAISFVLSGYYYEQRWINHTYTYNPVKWFNKLSGNDLHRVVLPNDRAHVWSLFIHRNEDVKSWGFMRGIGSNGLPSIQEFKYNNGKNNDWWKTAPIGKIAKGSTKDFYNNG